MPAFENFVEGIKWWTLLLTVSGEKYSQLEHASFHRAPCLQIYAFDNYIRSLRKI